MNIEHAQSLYEKLERDSVIQNYIAQANARYILYNTNESKHNFPRYNITDEKLNTLALQYLNIGCSLFAEKKFSEAIKPLEKGAAILEYCHGSVNAESINRNIYCLISAMAYYVSFQYSKSFILISKIEGNTIISSIIALFLKRKFNDLQNRIYAIVTDESYSDDELSKDIDEDQSHKIYEIIIAKSLNNYLQFYYTGDKSLLQAAEENLNNLLDIANIKNEPDIWWVIRLLLLIIDGFKESSLWHVLGRYFDVNSDYPYRYINALIFNKKNITELFLTQRNSLPIVLNTEQKGCVVSIPTSSGKTRIGEIAILNCIANDPEAKVLFIAPFKSLAYEIENSLDEIFGTIDIVVSHLYGGSLFSQLDQETIEESSVIIATPEKAKAMLRGNSEVMESIKLVIIDEGHLLGADNRLITNEMFYEELKYYIARNNGRFLVLSAVLPNANDLSQWFTESNDNIHNEKWRPADERVGTLEWTGANVNLKWQSNDTERNSFNMNFIVQDELPRQPRQRKLHYFPSDKNQAVAATAYKLSQLGSVLIFVGRKQSVFTIAKELEKCIKEESEFIQNDLDSWKAFKLACIEIYGEDSLWYKYAKLGIFCHNADLLPDVKLPLERLMRSEKPRAIIATSTLGQGVNLGVSSVIFSTFYQAGSLITSRDFWNIAGRAGRAFVDHEGKILVALDLTKLPSKVRYETSLASTYLDKSNIDKAISGLLSLIAGIKHVASQANISFEKLIELMADNVLSEQFNEPALNDAFDCIDDSLLSLHKEYNDEGSNSYAWVEQHFSKSLAYLQSKEGRNIQQENILQFLEARTKGIIKHIGDNRLKWDSTIISGIPVSSSLQLDDILKEITSTILTYMDGELSIENRIILLSNIENLIKEVNIYKAKFVPSTDMDIIRSKWLNGVSISEITQYENSVKIINEHYAFNLPWILNAISKKLRYENLPEEASVVEELSILVELGLPTSRAVKIYRAGIRSRSAATEVDSVLVDYFGDSSAADYKRNIIRNAASYKEEVSENTASWIDLLTKFAVAKTTKIDIVDDFRLAGVSEKTKRLIAKKVNGQQYLLSPDLQYIQSVNHDIFNGINSLDGIYFDYNESKNTWEITNKNPYIKID